MFSSVQANNNTDINNDWLNKFQLIIDILIKISFSISILLFIVCKLISFLPFVAYDYLWPLISSTLNFIGL